MSRKRPTRRLSADAAGLAEAVGLLRGGGLVALPTETVYGLAARADEAGAVARIYAAKGRPSFNPLIVHVHSLAQARELAHVSDEASSLAEAHWPGPLTLVLPLMAEAPLVPAVTAGLATVALRSPGHSVMRAVLTELDVPLAAPSANRSGFISPTTADHVLASLDGRIDAVLDAGPCAAGLESTIVAVRPGGALEVLREGPIELAVAAASDGRAIEAPGQLLSHYSPGKPLRLDAAAPSKGEFFIGFGAMACDANLSRAGDLVEAAARLYACLHLAAAAAQPAIAVAPIPSTGLGRAINDRLRRAAAPPAQRSGS